MVAERTFWIGCWPGLEEAHLDHVAETMQRFDTTRGRPALTVIQA
jgi:dTDP-4-amino-4,6-dideoxygalactose transaminase